MHGHPRRLRLVASRGEAIEPASQPDAGAIGLLAFLLAVNLVPVASEVAHVGRWGSGTVGLATACALVTARALWAELRGPSRARS